MNQGLFLIALFCFVCYITECGIRFKQIDNVAIGSELAPKRTFGNKVSLRKVKCDTVIGIQSEVSEKPEKKGWAIAFFCVCL